MDTGGSAEERDSDVVNNLWSPCHHLPVGLLHLKYLPFGSFGIRHAGQVTTWRLLSHRRACFMRRCEEDWARMIERNVVGGVGLALLEEEEGASCMQAVFDLKQKSS